MDVTFQPIGGAFGLPGFVAGQSAHASFDCNFDPLAGAPNAVQDADHSGPERRDVDLVSQRLTITRPW